MFLTRNKKNNVYPCKPQFYYIKVGFKGSELYRHVSVMAWNIKVSNFRTITVPDSSLAACMFLVFFFVFFFTLIFYFSKHMADLNYCFDKAPVRLLCWR